MAVFGVALAMVINEIKLNLGISDEMENLLTGYITISSLALVASQYFSYQYYLKW